MTNAATSGPVAPTNRVRKLVPAAPSPTPAGPRAARGSGGPQHRKRMNPPMINCHRGWERLTSTAIPSPVPTAAPGANQAMVRQSTWRQAIRARLLLEPS